MDEEDLADAADSQRLGTSEAFTGIGGRDHDSLSTDRFMSLLHVKSETAGVLLLNRMGWRNGQGIGPKVSRRPRLGGAGVPTEENTMAIGSSYLFAPDDTALIPFSKKTDRSGLGLHSLEGSAAHQYPGKTGAADGRHQSLEPRALGGAYSAKITTHGPSSRRGFGVGVLNDSDSGEDDPYEIGPKITQIRRVRKPLKTKSSARGQGAIQASSSAPVVGPRPGGTGHDEKNPLGGFVRGPAEDIEASIAPQVQSSFSVPASWTPSGRQAVNSAGEHAPMHHRASSPSTSKSAARGRLLGEPEAFNPQSSRPAQITTAPPDQAPRPTRQAAEAALGKEQNGRGPYPTQPPKRERYRRYLEYYAGLSALAPTQPDGMAHLDFSQELVEFYNCVAIFKPMVATMASRFTAAAASVPTATSQAAAEISHDKDTPREAARLGMFGHMTRTMVDFTPCSLLCKRFNVTPPRPDAPAKEDYTQPWEAAAPCMNNMGGEGPPLQRQGRPTAAGRAIMPAEASPEKVDADKGNPAKSEHVSAQVFDAIFGDE